MARLGLPSALNNGNGLMATGKPEVPPMAAPRLSVCKISNTSCLPSTTRYSVPPSAWVMFFPAIRIVSSRRLMSCSLDSALLTSVEATAWLARDTAGLVTCGLLAPQLQLLGVVDQDLLLDGLLAHLNGQKEALRRSKRLVPDSTDPFLQVLSRPMYLHRVWEHLKFLDRARQVLCTAAHRLPRSTLAGHPANLVG